MSESIGEWIKADLAKPPEAMTLAPPEWPQGAARELWPTGIRCPDCRHSGWLRSRRAWSVTSRFRGFGLPGAVVVVGNHGGVVCHQPLLDYVAERQ